jgi:uncharacterized repeat protein (TIGR03803 family)
MPNTLVYGTDGYLYGTTTHSIIGLFQSYGTIFKMATNSQIVTQYALNFIDGSYPFAGVVQASDGNFYGTTHDGGASGNGTIFRIFPDGSFTRLVSFDGFNDGAHPAAALVQGPDGALYGTTTTGGWGGRGTVFRLSYTLAPQIITQPVIQTVEIGGVATFYVTVVGASPLHYQWRRFGTNITNGINISGATARILTLSNITVADARSLYSVVVTNALGTATSSGAPLTLLFPPSFLSVAKSNDSVILSWSTVQGQKYQLQRKFDLKSGSWANLGSLRTATGGTLSASDPIGSNSQKFYRVLRVP